VSSLVPDDRVEKFGMILREGTPESLPVFGFGGDEEIHGQLVERLQLLESNLAFETGGALKKVHWEDPEREPILETREEREIVTLPVYSIKQHYQPPTVVASTALMERATDSLIFASSTEMQISHDLLLALEIRPEVVVFTCSILRLKKRAPPGAHAFRPSSREADR